jgi:hypothetical protein
MKIKKINKKRITMIVMGHEVSWQKRKLGSGEETKENGANGKYPYEAWYDV